MTSSFQANAASTDWEDLGGGKARMLAEYNPVTNQISAVVEIVLNPGWKTYWREPGASGIPPLFDLAKSRGFAAGEPLLPVPEHIRVGETEFIGYRGRVLFVLEGSATQAPPDGILSLQMLAGVCEEICIPASAQFEIPFSGLMSSDPEALAILEEARASLPGEPHDGLAIRSATTDANGGIRVVVVATGKDEAELFTEGRSGAFVEPARPVERDGTISVFEIQPGNAALESGQGYRFTLVQDGTGIEQWIVPER